MNREAQNVVAPIVFAQKKICFDGEIFACKLENIAFALQVIEKGSKLTVSDDKSGFQN